MRYGSIGTIGTFDALSPGAATDFLHVVPARCSGGGDAPLRTDYEEASGQDGIFVFPPFDDAQIITLAGDLVIRSAGDESGYLDAIDTLYASLKAALDAMKAAPDTLTHSGPDLLVWKYAPIVESWNDALMQVTFGLIVDSDL